MPTCAAVKQELLKRRDSRRLYAEGVEWYRHLRPGSFGYIDPPKLVLKGIAKQSTAGLLEGGTAFDGANCPAIVVKADSSWDVSGFLLGVLNSLVVSFHVRSVAPPKLGGYSRLNARAIGDVPIPVSRLTGRPEGHCADEIARKARSLTALEADLHAATVPTEQAQLGRAIKDQRRRLDQLVGEAYGLSQDELAQIEPSFKDADA